MHRYYEKIVDNDLASALVIEWRLNQACKIVFTYGVFDLLHEGHKQMLYEASYYGHKLVVGVNNDSSAKRLKGPRRPIEPLSVREYNLAQLPFVDLVIPFCEKRPLSLVKRLMPDVLVKGGEFTPGELIGRDYVLEVETIPKIHNISTTKIIEQMGLPLEHKLK